MIHSTERSSRSLESSFVSQSKSFYWNSKLFSIFSADVRKIMY